MNKLEKLKAELEKRKAAGLALCDKVEAEDREFTDEENATYAEIEADVEGLEAKIKAEEQLRERRRSMAPLSPAGSTTVNDLNPETTGGFADIGEFASAVHAAVHVAQTGGIIDPRLAPLAATMQGGGSSGEGFMLPPQYRDEVWDLVVQFDEFGPLIDEEPTSRRNVKIGADETTPWGTSGIKAYWRKEGAKMTEGELDDDGRDVPLHELYTLALATEELLEDAPRLQNRLTNKAAEAISFKKNHAIVEGTGAGQPLGWLKSKAKVRVTKESGQAAGTIVAKNVIKMYSRLLMMPGSRPFWLANSNTLPELMTMTVGDKPIWMPSNGLADAPGGFLLGLPVRFSEFAETVGTEGDLQLIQPKGYYGVRRASGEKFASSIHLYFDYGKQAFRWVFPYGGMPHLSKPVSPMKGSATKSHFITLETRS